MGERVLRVYKPWLSARRYDWACPLLILLTGGALYSNTLHVPWYFDDLPGLVENAAIRDLGGRLSALLSPRGVANLSFALNYRFGGLDVFGYHLVNIGVHLCTSLLVFLLCKRVFRGSALLPLLSALLFVAHPLQTQAVTYVVQRMTSLAALFFFLALYLYVRARETAHRSGGFTSAHWAFYAAALLCGALAVLTKQNAAILPLVLFLFDRYFLPRGRFRSWQLLLLYLLPFFLAPAWVALKNVVLPVSGGQSVSDIGRVKILSSQKRITPLTYLVTEFSVLWLYIRLLFLPYGQALDYSYPVATTLADWRHLPPLLGHLALLVFALFLRRRNPLVSFGILWFFLTLAVESSFIPLDPAFEHRLYVPMFGFALALVGLLSGLLPPRYGTGVLLLVLPIFALLTWQRNALWNDPVAFYEDNLRRAPHSERVSVSLAKSYMDAGRDDNALLVLQRALAINPAYEEAYINLSKIYIEKGAYEQALSSLQRGLAAAPASKKLLDNLGSLYDKLGQPQRAIQYLSQSIAVAPRYSQSHLNLGVVYAGLGRWDEAIAAYRKAIDLSHEYPVAHFNLGVAYYRLGNLPAALQQFRTASEQDPGDADALFNMASVALELGERRVAAGVLPQLRGLNARLAADLERELATSDTLVQ